MEENQVWVMGMGVVILTLLLEAGVPLFQL